MSQVRDLYGLPSWIKGRITIPPLDLWAVQVDDGSEFEAIFKEECQRRDIKLFVLPPHSPKLNGAVERAHRTHTKEFYEVTENFFELSELKDELLEWEGDI